jgi:hypothetical protein
VLASLAVLAAASSDWFLGYVNQVPSLLTVALSLGVFVLILPASVLSLSVPLAAGLVHAFFWVNGLKLAAVTLPVTFLDLKLLLTEPGVVFNALGVGSLADRRTIAVGLVIAAGILVVGIFFGVAARRRLAVPEPRVGGGSRTARLAIRAAAMLVLLSVAATCLVRYGQFVNDRLSSLYPALSVDLWTPQSQVTLFRRLGVLEYIAFTYAAGDGETLAFSWKAAAKSVDLRAASRSFVNVARRSSSALAPNIVFFHAESTFDPNDAFRLSERVDLPLWSGGRATQAIGPLLVNVIGGGSWVTEFEVLTGVDSRLFGYQGFYTHQYLSPIVRNSFPKYLAQKGYHTIAYYPVEGSFFNAQSAFENYGLQEFIDGPALGLSADWSQIVDRDVIGAIIRKGAFERPGPSFYFISTTENHGPHACHSESAQPFRVRFVGPASPEQTCTLHEYLRRARSTSDAFEAVAAQLRAIEKRTGRPYVLLAYGDHQPWSFTDGRYSVAGSVAADSGVGDFSALRSRADGHVTIFHLQASARGVLKRKRFTDPPPATFLPTLVSAFVAASEDDLYVPLNFLAFSQCGSDFRRGGCSLYPDILGWLSASLLTPPRAPVGTSGS